MSDTGRPRKEIDLEKLKLFMRLNPSKEEASYFFEVSPDTIERRVREAFDLTYEVFREQQMVHTRSKLITRALDQAERDKIMLIFCLKNLCGWRDKQPDEEPLTKEDLRPRTPVTQEERAKLIAIARGTDKSG